MRCELIDDALYRSNLNTIHEAQANALAADLLMPIHLLSQAQVQDKSSKELAKLFEVSEQAMSIRLEHLGPSRAVGV